MSTVYVIQKPRPKGDGWMPNLEPASQYGKLDFIFDASDRAFADPGEALEKAYRKLAKFDAAEDYLLWANFGDPATLWAVIALLSATGCPRLRYLYWSRGRKDGAMSNENGFYFPVEIDVSKFIR